MDIQKFQQKLTEVCELGEKNGKVLKPEQIKECFGELDLDKSQLIKILQYLKLKGISIEGAEEISAASQTGPEEVSEEKEEKGQNKAPDRKAGAGKGDLYRPRGADWHHGGGGDAGSHGGGSIAAAQRLGAV